ncbi:uncharacterized protein LOC135352027 [Halichondria panicea]|uniref:uncharacterized protein LOC135352027 n=1 Tax=Halichondria panicea TaxID=6063 RepID=UPI00312B4B89
MSSFASRRYIRFFIAVLFHIRGHDYLKITHVGKTQRNKAGGTAVLTDAASRCSSRSRQSRSPPPRRLCTVVESIAVSMMLTSLPPFHLSRIRRNRTSDPIRAGRFRMIRSLMSGTVPSGFKNTGSTTYPTSADGVNESAIVNAMCRLANGTLGCRYLIICSTVNATGIAMSEGMRLGGTAGSVCVYISVAAATGSSGSSSPTSTSPTGTSTGPVRVLEHPDSIVRRHTPTVVTYRLARLHERQKTGRGTGAITPRSLRGSRRGSRHRSYRIGSAVSPGISSRASASSGASSSASASGVSSSASASGVSSSAASASGVSSSAASASGVSSSAAASSGVSSAASSAASSAMASSKASSKVSSKVSSTPLAIGARSPSDHPHTAAPGLILSAAATSVVRLSSNDAGGGPGDDGAAAAGDAARGAAAAIARTLMPMITHL